MRCDACLALLRAISSNGVKIRINIPVPGHASLEVNEPGGTGMVFSGGLRYFAEVFCQHQNILTKTRQMGTVRTTFSLFKDLIKQDDIEGYNSRSREEEEGV